METSGDPGLPSGRAGDGVASIDDLLDRCLSAESGDGFTLTLDRRFQGFPDTAHGGSVLAVFDSVAREAGAREVLGVYRRRVPLGVPLALGVRREGGGARFELRDERVTLIEGRIEPADREVTEPPRPSGPAHPLPVSRACFACGLENEIGLRVRLEFDDQMVGGEYLPRDQFRRGDGTVAPAVLTTLLDETAFWLGALATGESGMTTEIRIRLHRPARFGARLIVSGLRSRVAPFDVDPRYRRTVAAIHDDRGALIASGRITFVAVRDAARSLVNDLLAMNPPDVVNRVFPAYADPAT